MAERRNAAARSDHALGVFLMLAAAIVLGIVALALAVSHEPPPPATTADRVVPADALLYVHVSTDPSRGPVKQALAVARRLPDFPFGEAAVVNRLDAILTGASGRSVDFSSQVRPWLGREAAFALLNTTTSTAGSLIVLEVRRPARARAFVQGAGATAAGSYRGRALLGYASGTTLAFVRARGEEFLVLGQPASVRAAIDASDGAIASLARSARYRQAIAGQPSDRVIDAYASTDGVRRVLAAQGGLLGGLGVLLYQPALTGTSVSISPSSGGLRIRVHDALDPTLARAGRAPAPEFAPTMAGVLPQGTTLLLDVVGLSHVAPRVLNAGAEGGIAGRIGPLLRRLGAALTSEGVDVGRITSLFAGETAVAVAPPATGSGHGPALVIVARTKHEDVTRQLLAQLEAPLAQLFPPPSNGPGQAPEFNNVPVAGVTAHQLVLAPGLQIDYAVFHGLVVVATSVQAIGAIARHTTSLAGASGFQATLGNRPDRVSSLVFLDFSQLLTLAEQTGLAQTGRLAALKADLAKIRAIGLVSTRGEADTTAELTLQI